MGTTKTSKSTPCVIILLIEPASSSHAPTISVALEKKGYQVTQVTTANEAIAQAQLIQPTTAVLDYSACKKNYAPLCHELRKECNDLPILVIMPENTEAEPDLPPNVIMLPSPFTSRKFLNRITRMQPEANDNVIRVGDLILYTQRRCLRHRGIEHRLTPMQTRLIEIFMRHPQEILSRRFLIKQVWETDYVGDTRTLDVHIRWLRKTIEDNPSKPRYITTVRGVGYRFEIPQDSGNPTEG